MRQTIAKERQAQIMQILVAEGHIKTGTIVDRFHVSSETARKDLIALAEQGIAQKTHGGAVIVDSYFAETDVFLNRRMKRNTAQKRAIAHFAAGLIPNGSTIILDSGSTTYWIARELCVRKNSTVITNSLTTAMTLAQNGVNVLTLGGEVHPSNLAAVGQWADLCLRSIRVDIAFIGASALSVTRGPCVENFPEAHAKWKMMESAARRYLVADSSKFQSSALIEYASWDQFDAIITDHALPEEIRVALEKKIELLFPEEQILPALEK